ncbi:MAG: hypothetical protein JJV99_10435 [Colwellia sp.]|nr:hypothetical protein [Colwellia sp.]
MKIFQLLILSASFLLSTSSFAHSGHDHASAYASLIHLFWLAPAFVALAILYNKRFKTMFKNNAQKQINKPVLKENNNVL